MENKINRSVTNSEGASAEIVSRWAGIFPDKDLDLLAFQIFAIRLGSLLVRRQEKICRENYGLNASHITLLVALLRLDGLEAVSAGELHRSLLVAPGTITKQVDRLVEHHLVERLPNVTDKREVIIRLTHSGRNIAHDAIESQINNGAVHDALKSLGASEGTALIGGLAKLLAALEAQETRGE
ncbi:MarR family winged helix-turn-helix transcriptional regulator [Sphingomonas sp. GB1N7]|uniref:MarR family winged helix-turn-helix transcriptional regulator n=1 Tax=Parasphingomonas caseinilytica TaxID=3096158 RepID=UPI002FC89162